MKIPYFLKNWIKIVGGCILMYAFAFFIIFNSMPASACGEEEKVVHNNMVLAAGQMEQDSQGRWVNEAGGNVYGDSMANQEADPMWNQEADPMWNQDADPMWNQDADPNWNPKADPNY